MIKSTFLGEIVTENHHPTHETVAKLPTSPPRAGRGDRVQRRAGGRGGLGSTRAATTTIIHDARHEFYEELDHVIQEEPVDFPDPELRGLAASIGLVKGKKFAPDERMRKILTDAVAVGNATARAISFRDRDERVAINEGSQWQSLSSITDDRWIDKDAEGARNLDARTKFFGAGGACARCWPVPGRKWRSPSGRRSWRGCIAVGGVWSRR